MMRSKREQLKIIRKNLKSRGLERGFDLAVAAVWLYGVNPAKRLLPLRQAQGRNDKENGRNDISSSVILSPDNGRDEESRLLPPRPITPATSPRRGGPPSPRQERESLVDFVVKPVRAEASRPGNAFDYLRLFKRAENSFSVEEPANASSGVLTPLSARSRLSFAKEEWSQPKLWDRIHARGLEKYFYGMLLLGWVKIIHPAKRLLRSARNDKENGRNDISSSVIQSPDGGRDEESRLLPLRPACRTGRQAQGRNDRALGFVVKAVRDYEELDKTRVVDLTLSQNHVLAVAWTMLKAASNSSVIQRNAGVTKNLNRSFTFAVAPVQDDIAKSNILPNQALAQSFLEPRNVWATLVILTKVRIQAVFQAIEETGSRIKSGMTGESENPPAQKPTIQVPSRKPELVGVIDRRSPFYRPRHRNAVSQKFAFGLYAALSKFYYRPRFATKPVKFQTEVAFYENHLAVAQFWRPPTLWEKILQPISAFLVILSRFLSSVILRPLAEESRSFRLAFARRQDDIERTLTRAYDFGAAIYQNSLAPRLSAFKDRMIASDEALVEEFRQDPALKYLQKFASTLQKIAATVSIIFLTFAPLAPPLAAETTILTDADVNPLSPVLQQIAEVTSSEGSNLIADIQKRIEEIVNPIITRPALPQEAIVELMPLPDNPSGETSPPADEASPADPPEVVLVQENGTTTLAEVISVTPIEPETPATPTSTPSTTPETAGNGGGSSPDTSESDSETSPGDTGRSCDLSLNPSPPPGEGEEIETPSPDEGRAGEGLVGSTATSTPTTTLLALPPLEGGGLPAGQAGNEGGGESSSSDTGDLSPTLSTPGEGEEAEQAACQPQSQSEAETQELLTDDDSLIDTTETVKNLVEIINTNSIKVVNEVKGQALTGQNQVVAGDEGRDALIASGDINVFTNVLNVVNTNLLNSKIIEIAENFNNLSADVLLNEPETRPQELTQDLVSQVCTALLCESLNSFNLTNRNYAEVENTVDLLGHSGQNLLQNIEERGTIRSGNVNAVVNILNIVNSNLLNSRWTIASINVFGDWEGDLVLPSELYFTDFMSIGAAGNSDISVEDINKVIINVENDNNVEVDNNVLVDSDSGQNELEATGTLDGKKGELENSQIAAGQSDGAANVKNFLNTNVFNGRWYLGMVNTLGNWSGDIFSLPEEVALGTTPAGLSFFASNQKDNDLLYQKFEETIAEISKRSTTTIDILNQNQAKLTNNVDLRSYSGENRIAAEQIDEGRIFAGNTYALANILNFANTNLINADLHVGMVNVLGRWNGNIVFGFPDLTVSQKIPGGVYPMEKNRTFDYEISYGNLGGSSMIGTAVEWQYDPGLLKLKAGSSSHELELKQPGKLVFALGKMTAQSAGKVTFKLQTLSNLAEGQAVQTYARISGIGPERNKTNNEHILVSNTVDTPEPPGSPPPPEPEPPPPGDEEEQQPPPGSGGSGGNPGGSAPGGSNPDSQGSGNPRGLLRVYKTNTGGGLGIKPGGKLDFTLTIDNDGIDTVYNVIVFDTLRGPDGTVVGTKKFPLGKMLSREEVVITYELEVNPVAPPGRYTNSAYAEALNFLLQPIKSESTAVSAFTVDNPNPAPYNPSQPVFAEEQLPGEADAATTTEDTLLKDQKETQEQENATSTEPVSLGLVGAAKTDRSGTEDTNSAATPGPFLSAAEQASALQINLPGLESPASKRGAFRNYSEQDKMLTIIIIAALIALGYATANLRHRVKEKPKS